MSVASNSEPRPATYCRKLPPGEFNGKIPETLAVYADGFIKVRTCIYTGNFILKVAFESSTYKSLLSKEKAYTLESLGVFYFANFTIMFNYVRD